MHVSINFLKIESELQHDVDNLIYLFFDAGEGIIKFVFFCHFLPRVMKAGAIDFLTKPFNDQVLLESINKALRIDKLNREKQQESAQAEAKFALLSPREVQVLQGIVAGKQNKVISAELKISLKTVEAHRASVMKKMSVKSVPELVKLVLTNGVVHEPTSEE